MPTTGTTNILAALEAEASKILGDIASGRHPVNATAITQLDDLASQSARTAYGSNHPELLSVTMSRLISWCDHLNEDWCVEKFKVALQHQPLAAPPWSGGHG